MVYTSEKIQEGRRNHGYAIVTISPSFIRHNFTRGFHGKPFLVRNPKGISSLPTPLARLSPCQLFRSLLTMVFEKHAKMGLFSPYKSRTAVEQHLDFLLAEACAEHSLDVVQFLLSKGAQPPNGARTDYDSADLAKERGHAWVDMINVASQSETMDAVAKADLLVRKSGYNGVIPGDWIDYAIRHEKIAALQVMLPQYRPNVHQCEHLHVAVDTATPNMQIVQLLIQAGEDVNKVPKKDSRPYAGEAPIHIATRRGSHEAVKLLRKHGAKVDIRGKNYRRTVRDATTTTTTTTRGWHA